MRYRAAIIIMAAIALGGCSRDQKKAEASSKPAVEPVAVQTVPAQARVLDRTIAVTGSIHPDETVTVSSEVPGRLATVHVDFGQNVRKGQVIAELDKRELSLAVERARASLAQALARLGLNADQANVRPETTPAIRQAQAQMEDAKSKFDNAARLVKTGDISQERYNEAEKAYEARRAVYEAARDESRTLLAQVAALKAEVQLAQKRLDDATVRAPFDGSVSQRVASPGQYLRDNAPILTLVKTNPLRLRVEVPEAASGVVKTGTTLAFTTDAAPGVTFQATVRELNPSLDAKSRTLTAEARLSANDPRLRPGMFVQVQLVLSKGQSAVLVPKQAVYNIAGLTKVFVIRNNKAEELKITPGQEFEGWVEVPADRVSPGDQIAVSALSQLVQDLPVKPAPRG